MKPRGIKPDPRRGEAKPREASVLERTVINRVMQASDATKMGLYTSKRMPWELLWKWIPRKIAFRNDPSRGTALFELYPARVSS